MGRLIDADALVRALGKSIGNNGNTVKIDVMDVKSLIKEQPTAYDVDKVVEKLENQIKRNITSCADTEENNLMLHDRNFGIHQAIEIVKRGGKDE